MEKIIAVAQEMKCEAIHPGYGFLAENDEFAALCEKNKIKFIGPSSKSIAKFGNKNEARKMLKAGGVPIVPGTKDKLRDFDEAKRVADYIGYPVMIKASAGGGGRGIKICNRWLNSFENFHKDMGDPPTNKHSLDRIDNNGDYSPRNCRWATNQQQCNNKRTNIKIKHNKKQYSIAEYCRLMHLNYLSFYRLYRREGKQLKEATRKATKVERGSNEENIHETR